MVMDNILSVRCPKGPLQKDHAEPLKDIVSIPILSFHIYIYYIETQAHTHMHVYIIYI